MTALAPMDPINAALVGYGVSWTLDNLFSIGGQGRALNNALGRALSQFRDRYPDMVDVIFENEAWKLFKDELKFIVSPVQQPDAGRLAGRLAGDDVGKARRLQEALSDLFEWVRNEAALEQKLVGIQSFRIAERVDSRLTSIEHALGTRLEISEVLARAREASNEDIEAFNAHYGVREYEGELELR